MKRSLAVALLAGSVSLLATLATAGTGLIEVPLRWCAVKGSPADVNPGGVGEPDTDNALWRRHERASDRVWIPGANITFRSGFTAEVRDKAKFPIIADPSPSGPGQPGDIGSGEIDTVVASCEQAWQDLSNSFKCVRADNTPCAGASGCKCQTLDRPCTVDGDCKVALVGPVAVNIRAFVDGSGNIVGLKGRGGTSYNYSGDICRDPTKFTAASGGYIVVTDYSIVNGFDADDKLTAHELGHTMGLNHGNGIDDTNPANGVYESPDSCDNSEKSDDENSPLQNPATIMQPSENKATKVVTTLQKGTARGVAAVHPGAKIDPPAVLLDVDAIGDQRIDAVGDVSFPSLDILAAGAIENRAVQTTLLFQRLFGTIPFGARNDYLFFFDLDGNAATGGAPASLGFDTTFTGADIVARVSVRASGGEISVEIAEPTVWKFQAGGFVQLTDTRIQAAIIESIEGETNTRHFDRVSVEIPNDLIGTMAGGCGVRLETMTQPTPTGGTGDGSSGGTLDGTGDGVVLTDRLPDSPDAQSDSLCMVAPRFPICTPSATDVQPGAHVAVDASGLVPDAMVKVFLGDVMMTGAMTDADGNVRVEFTVPSGTAAGPRLITVGTLGTALTADCSFTVHGGAVVCGDRFVGPGEQCDDGNTTSGDCCSATCQQEHEGPHGDATCSNNRDDDCDGLVDNADPDCNHPPDCTAAVASPSEIWPPRRRFVDVTVGGVTDADGDPLTLTVTDITQDEPLFGREGAGRRCPDGAGVGSSSATLRAERIGRRDGRVYHVGFTAEDGFGGRCNGLVTACVPHDQRPGHVCIDEGPLFDSTGPCN